ncbi:uncharacterized protein LOC132338500 isoform X3 [Haemorhous mexicanus]|uniref:uncharacterized protein LOC132338500 isoform X3 n=1 Tax=Haemorhous mexicanus TaxID=30427 RepID=UPI0028BE912C|nr:uncharacterized protein LOC132338500 isoform X3 [Haemorhous mexicanus]
MWEVLPTLLAPQVPPPAGIHGIPSIPIMLFQSSWAVLLLCTTAGFLGWLGLAAPPKKEELWETWMRSALDETPVAQLMQDIARWMGNVSSCRAAELQGGQLSNLHQEQERPQDIHPQPESILVLQEVMEKLQRVNQSLELMLMALEDAQSRLEKHLEHLKAVPDLDGEWEWGLEDQWELVGTNTRLFFPIPQVRAKVSPPPASHTAHTWCSWFSHWCRCHSGPSFSSSSSLPAPSVFQQSPLSWSLLRQVGTSVGTVAGDTPPWGGRVCPPPPSHSPTGHWLLASACRGARRIRPVVSREKARYRLTSTPERECDMELLQEELDRMEMSCLQNERCPQEPSPLEQSQEVAGDIPQVTGQVSPDSDRQRTTPSSCGVTTELVMYAGKLWEPKPCSPRANMCPCQGLTRAGQRCRKKAIPGLEFCHIHSTSSSSAMDSSPHF